MPRRRALDLAKIGVSKCLIYCLTDPKGGKINMFVLGNFFQAVAVVLGYLFEFYFWLIVIRALLSWVSPDPYNAIVQFIERATEPVLAPMRRLVPTHRIGIDLSPLLAILLLHFLKIFVIQTLMGLAVRLQ